MLRYLNIKNGKKIYIFRSGSLGDICVCLPLISKIASDYPNHELVFFHSFPRNLLGDIDVFLKLFGIDPVLRSWPKTLLHWIPIFIAINRPGNKTFFFDHLGSGWSSVAKRFFSGVAHKYKLFLNIHFPETCHRNTSEYLRFASLLTKQIEVEDYLRIYGHRIKIDSERYPLKKEFAEIDCIVAVETTRPANSRDIQSWFELCSMLLERNIFKKIGLVGVRPLQIKSPSQNIIDLTGKTSLGDLFQLLRCSSFFISGDTGVAHLGAVLGCRGIVVMGLRDIVGKWDPPQKSILVLRTRENHVCKECSLTCCPKVKSCVSDISNYQIVSHVELLLSDRKLAVC